MNKLGQSSQFKRVKNFELLIKSVGACETCLNFKKLYKRKEKGKLQRINQLACLNAPLSNTHPNRVKLPLQVERAKTSKMKTEMEQIKNEIAKSAASIDDDLSADIESIMSQNVSNISPFMQLFWEQQKVLCKKGAKKCHPMLIRFCLSLASKLFSAYDELRDSKIIVLPSQRTLRDYKNVITPKAGSNSEIIKELMRIAEPLTVVQRFVVLSSDEMKIQQNLVYNKHIGQLVGFVYLGDQDLNINCFDKVDQLATHALVYYIRGLASDLKFSLAYLATKGATAYQIMPTFWEAVPILEFTCKLSIIPTVSEGAPSNRNFYRIHRALSGLADDKVVY